MNRIAFPVGPQSAVSSVSNLQDVLHLCLEYGELLATDEVARRELSALLARERDRQIYDRGTADLVSRFQKERGLATSGEVDEPTADALNELLRKWGLIDAPAVAADRIVSGAVRREDGAAAVNVRVRAEHGDARGAILLGEGETDAKGRYTIRYAPLSGVDVALRVSAVDADGVVLGAVDARTAGPLEIVDLILPMARPAGPEARIEGRILAEHGAPAAELALRLYRLDFGGAATLLVETKTLASGHYSFAYDPGGRAANLQVRMVSPTGEETALSKPLSGRVPKPLNLVAPAAVQPLAAEYRRLSGDLTAEVGGMTKLVDARENDDRQDLTALNRATGWDARLIALAATAERLNADPDVPLPQESLYGLMRAGLPSDKLALAQVEPEAAEQALRTVRDAGIVDLSDQQIADFKGEFSAFATKVRLDVTAPGSNATYAQMLAGSGLPADAQAKFAPVYLAHRGDGAKLWEEARSAGLDAAEIGKLQRQGKFAFLAGNSEPMTARLMEGGANDPVQLVDQAFDRADKWESEVLDLARVPNTRRNALNDADRTRLEAVIPARYTGTAEDRLQAYAADMARKVRAAYPTQVVRRLVEQDEIRLPAARDATVKLLNQATEQGFRLGETPVETFLNSRTGAGADDDLDAARQQLKLLHRVYQITPSNEACRC